MQEISAEMDNSDENKVMKQHYSKDRIFKVIVVGDSNVGKTSLTYRFCEGKFLDSPEATIGVDFRSKVLWIDDEKITLQLWDTAGQERFRKTMVRHYYRNANAVVFVYDVTNSSSFDSLKKWIIEVDLHCPSDIPRILVGNKCDNCPNVKTNDAQTFADHHNMPLFETSARLDSEYDNVESIFLTLAHKLKNQKPFFAPKIDREPNINETSTSTSSCC